jgi:two-component system, NarL family, response regulator
MNEGELIRVLIADDHEVVREGLNGILRRQKMHVVAEACNGKEAIELYRLHRPDILLMDLRMPLMDGLTATRALIAEFPHARIIVLTNSEGEEHNSLHAGAKALVQKDAPSSELVCAIHAVHNAAS